MSACLSGGGAGEEDNNTNSTNNTANTDDAGPSGTTHQAYILEPEAILDHCVNQGTGKKWYLVKWKPKWVKKNELPEGVYEKWQARKNGIGLDEPEDGLRILEERRVTDEELAAEQAQGDEDEDEDDDEDDDDEDDEEEEEEKGENATKDESSDQANGSTAAADIDGPTVPKKRREESPSKESPS